MSPVILFWSIVQFDIPFWEHFLVLICQILRRHNTFFASKRSRVCPLQQDNLYFEEKSLEKSIFHSNDKSYWRRCDFFLEITQFHSNQLNEIISDRNAFSYWFKVFFLIILITNIIFLYIVIWFCSVTNLDFEIFSLKFNSFQICHL